MYKTNLMNIATITEKESVCRIGSLIIESSETKNLGFISA